jgi:hypothetical protein
MPRPFSRSLDIKIKLHYYRTLSWTLLLPLHRFQTPPVELEQMSGVVFWF